VVCLDAPAEVLYARKPEGCVEALEQRRQEYFRIRDEVPVFEVVNADAPLDEVTSAVSNLIRKFHGRHPHGSMP
jgi:hypothetical protein